MRVSKCIAIVAQYGARIAQCSAMIAQTYRNPPKSVLPVQNDQDAKV